MNVIHNAKIILKNLIIVYNKILQILVSNDKSYIQDTSISTLDSYFRTAIDINYEEPNSIDIGLHVLIVAILIYDRK